MRQQSLLSEKTGATQRREYHRAFHEFLIRIVFSLSGGSIFNKFARANLLGQTRTKISLPPNELKTHIFPSCASASPPPLSLSLAIF